MLRGAMLACLVFSGFTALVYQLIWTRLLGFTFGTTQEAIGSVLAIFFGGMAIGNALAARQLARVERPLRMYALLEGAIGVAALVSLPVLLELHRIYALVGVDLSPAAMTALRLAASAVVLLPPTIAMGATLPVVARGLIARDESVGENSALLYAANTFGAVLGAYLCGFWLIPLLGLTASLLAAAAVNLVIALGVFCAARQLRAPAPTAADDTPSPGPALPRAPFLAFFAVSGFVAIGYEIVWSKVFGIVMEGTLYGFAAVLSAYLFGIALGSLAVARTVDRIRDLPRVFGLLHVAIAACVALGFTAVPYLPYLRQRLAEGSQGGDAVHLLFLLVLPIMLVPAALFGAAFPVLIRIYTRRAGEAGAGIGLATAVNTAGSIAASLGIGFVAMPRLGMDATLFGLLVLDLAVGLAVLLLYQTGAPRERLLSTAGAAAVFLTVSLAFGGVGVDRAIAGLGQSPELDLAGYQGQVERLERSQKLRVEGKTSIVTLYEVRGGLRLHTNGLPESGTTYAPPYAAAEMDLLSALPYVIAAEPRRALVIGLGGGHTLSAMLDTRLESVEVVELERGVISAVEMLFAGRKNPLADPRVTLRVNDGRNELLLGRYRGGEGYDVIASQPSHPWRLGAANLFTEDFFALVRENLTQGGVAAIWVNGFRTDAEAFLAVAASFERVFPGALLFAAGPTDPRRSLVLLGGRAPLSLRVAQTAARMAEPALARRLALHDIRDVDSLLARSEGPLANFTALAPDAANTDDNALLEVHVPRKLRVEDLDFAALEARLPVGAPVLPPLDGPADIAAVATRWLDTTLPDGSWPYSRKLERLLAGHPELDPVRRETLSLRGALRGDADEDASLAALSELSARHPERPEPWRALGLHLAGTRRDFAAASRAFAAAHARSGAARDAYDAGRALHHEDPEAAWTWFERIPPGERAEFPRLPFYRMGQALANGASDAELRARVAELERYRDTREGRTFPGIDDLLARALDRLGDPEAASYAEVARRRSHALGERKLKQALTAMAEGRLDDVAAAVTAARSLLPADPRVIELEAARALAAGQPDRVAAALAELRRWAPELDVAISAENQFRARHGLALLPRERAEVLFAGDRRPTTGD